MRKHQVATEVDIGETAYPASRAPHLAGGVAISRLVGKVLEVEYIIEVHSRLPRSKPVVILSLQIHGLRILQIASVPRHFFVLPYRSSLESLRPYNSGIPIHLAVVNLESPSVGHDVEREVGVVGLPLASDGIETFGITSRKDAIASAHTKLRAVGGRQLEPLPAATQGKIKTLVAVEHIGIGVAVEPFGQYIGRVGHAHHLGKQFADSLGWRRCRQGEEHDNRQNTKTYFLHELHFYLL